jgi:hypothetical protein
MSAMSVRASFARRNRGRAGHQLEEDDRGGEEIAALVEIGSAQTCSGDMYPR